MSPNYLTLKNIRVKDESSQKNGTYKDRKARFILDKALKAGVKKLVIITSGNAGYALGKISKPRGIKVVSVVDTSISKKVEAKLRQVCYKVIKIDLQKKFLSSKELIILARENELEKIWDVTNGYEQSYEDIIKELKHTKFDYLICPIGSGEAFTGLLNGLKKYKMKSKLVGISISNTSSFADKLSTKWTPYKNNLRSAVKDGHKIVRINEHEVKKLFHFYKNKIKCEPSSAVVWAAFEKVKFMPKARVVVLNSGKGIF